MKNIKRATNKKSNVMISMVNISAKQLDIFVQEVPRTTNMIFAKFKCFSNLQYLNKAKIAREQILKSYHIKYFANDLQILSQAPHNI